jgi:aryl-alcohol dehydrogenase-like predicted oxidoreductase
MEIRRLGSVSLDVPVVGMGTWQSYDVRDPALVRPVTDAVLAHGARLFDSSPMYGSAERVLAAVLENRREAAIVATKVWASSAREGRAQIARALEWYGGVVDVYQIHNLEAWQTHLPYLEELKAQGKVRAIGLTHYRQSELGRLADIAAARGVDSLQVPYNPHEREIERVVLPLAAERRLGIIVMRPLGAGALVGSSPAARDLTFLEAFGIRTWAQALLNWGLSDPRVTVSIPATRKVPHARDNCDAGAARRFDAETRERVAALAARP